MDGRARTAARARAICTGEACSAEGMVEKLMIYSDQLQSLLRLQSFMETFHWCRMAGFPDGAVAFAERGYSPEQVERALAAAVEVVQ